MADGAGEEGDENVVRVVSLYDFDPSSIDWPFRRQQPLPLQRGQMVNVIHDDGSLWAFGHIVDHPDVRGYFPKNYTVSHGEYNEMMQAFEEDNMADQGQYDDDEGAGIALPADDVAIPAGPLRAPTTVLDTGALPERTGPSDEVELAYMGIAEYPVLDPQPPQATTLELTKSRLLREMPSIPQDAMEEPAPPEDDIMAAREEVERELAEMEDPNAIIGGKLSESRASTPATYTQTRPERDFVRKQIPMEQQMQFLHPLSQLTELISNKIKLSKQEPAPYAMDMRVRSTTCRIAAHIEPPHMRMALQRSAASGARWTQMFRPGFNDIVNESFRVGCNACILSHFYLRDADVQMQFQKIHAQDVNGTLWFELRRQKDHLFYMRMDMVDVMMCHPTAWGFPDTDNIVSANPGEPINPFHGWYAQTSINTDKEMEDVEFTYNLRLRFFPKRTFEALSLGKMPEWIQPYMTLHAKAEKEESEDEDEEAENPKGHGSQVQTDNNLLLEAGLEDSEDMYVRLDELRLARERTVGPDVLDLESKSFRLKGLSAMRIFLRSRGQPDNMKQAQITPKMVKDMAAQLGIRKDPAHYWYCMFALRYPLAHEWEAVVRNDTRLYLHLPSDRLQPIHPMIKRFREHLDDCMQNEFLWDYRGFVNMKCSECGIPESVVWCQQCTDYFCADCLLKSHKSARGKKHCLMPIPGCRYLTQAEAVRLSSHLPLLNVGFSNRRRFLARDNQSDKMGSRSGDTWLFFDADTFQAALQQAPEKHWYLKRMFPPRLAPDAEGYYYNFGHDVIADDASHILTKAHEQKALSVLQRCIRGAITRRRIKKEVNAALVIQKSKKMWDCKKLHGSNGRNAAIMKAWYRKYKAKKDREILGQRMARVQAAYLGFLERKEFRWQIETCTRFQSAFRGLQGRRVANVVNQAVRTIQRYYRGHLYGRRPVQEMHESASRIQALARGVAFREKNRDRIKKATHIEAHARGMLARLRVRRMKAAGLKLQTNWRRFQAQLDIKIMLYDRLEKVRQKRKEILQAKLEDKVAAILQRNFRRHRDYQKYIFARREKGDCDKRTSTMLVALFSAAGQMRHFVHPWWRHLPPEIQDVLRQIKASMQRSIGLVPVSGKLANEEMGKRGLRTAHYSNLHYDQTGRDPDLASHMLLSVTRHLMSHVPAELFTATVNWACYAIGHQAVALNNMKGAYPMDDIKVGEEMPAHPGDSLSTLWKDVGSIKHHHDWLLTLPEESLPILIMHKMPIQQRQVSLTAEVLISMRQALDNPQISIDDHLKFQGLDASSGAQMMEVIGSELDQKLPLDWPKSYGTVAALANQISTYIKELQPDKKNPEAAKPKAKGKAKAEPKGDAKGGTAPAADRRSSPAPAASKSKAKAKSAAAKSAATAKKEVEASKPTKEAPISKPPPEAGQLSSFNRTATLRIVQQVGYFMRGQDKLIKNVVGEDDADRGRGVRQSRYISVTDKLFEMADRAKHDHCTFVLAVVLYHMVLRGLLLRVLYHRAAIALQKRYRYLKNKGKKAHMVAPATCIQRFWRGTSTALLIMRKDDAAFKIQQSWRAWRYNKRARNLLNQTLKIQRIWLGAITRMWLKECHGAATYIQKVFRGVLVRLVLNKDGRELQRKFKKLMAEEILAKKSQMSESTYLAKAAALTGRMNVQLHQHRMRQIDIRRMQSYSLRSSLRKSQDKERKLKLKGAIQPCRRSVFEPMAVALARLEPKQENRYGSKNSRVLVQVYAMKKKLDRMIPKEASFKHHAAASRGRNAVAAMRLAKKPKEEKKAVAGKGPVDAALFTAWAAKQFAV
eukprot:TRINITY_DN54196_c0_g1_i1.p1 TRINITY_DN54196_c0_g1~~TRINITY_DN54196_c0_g1_i1.p1  ORF type:complete len:1836 (-),score=531.89 TRINITY_DN54196_c0_g1_i1:66-5468(-)